MGPALGLLSLALFMPRLQSRNLCPARRPDGASENPGTQRAAISSVTFDSCVCEDRTQTIAVAEAKAEAEVEDVSLASRYLYVVNFVILVCPRWLS